MIEQILRRRAMGKKGNVFDITNLTYTGKSLDISGLTFLGYPSGITISPDGSHLYVCDWGNNSAGKVFQYDLLTPNDVSTGTYIGASGSLSVLPILGGIDVKADGTKMYVCGYEGGNYRIGEFTIGTPWAASGISNAGFDYRNVTSIISPSANFPDKVKVSPDGTKAIYVRYDGSGKAAYRLTPSPSGTINGSISYSGDNKTFYTQMPANSDGAFDVTPDGLRAIAGQVSGSNLYQYDTASPWDLSGLTYNSIVKSLSSLLGSGTYRDAKFSGNGKFVYILDSNANRICQLKC